MDASVRTSRYSYSLDALVRKHTIATQFQSETAQLDRSFWMKLVCGSIVHPKRAVYSQEAFWPKLSTNESITFWWNTEVCSPVLWKEANDCCGVRILYQWRPCQFGVYVRLDVAKLTILCSLGTWARFFHTDLFKGPFVKAVVSVFGYFHVLLFVFLNGKNIMLRKRHRLCESSTAVST